MSQSYISVTIPPAVVTTVKDALQTAITALQPYAKGLSADERKMIVKMGDKSKVFAEKVHTYFGTNPAFMPPYVNATEYAKDYAVPDQLSEILGLAQQAFEMIDDTIMAAGSDVMEVSNIFFTNLKQAARNGQPGAQAIYDDLKARYPGRPPKHDATPGA